MVVDSVDLPYSFFVLVLFSFLFLCLSLFAFTFLSLLVTLLALTTVSSPSTIARSPLPSDKHQISRRSSFSQPCLLLWDKRVLA